MSRFTTRCKSIVIGTIFSIILMTENWFAGLLLFATWMIVTFTMEDY